MTYNDFLVIGVTPANSETNVSLSTSVEIFFIEAIDTESISPATIYLQNVSTGSVVPSSLQYLHADRKVILTPSDSLQSLTGYRIVILGGEDGIFSVGGSIMLETKYYTFITEEVVAEEPEETEDEPSDDQDPTPPVSPGFVFEPFTTYPKKNDANVSPKTIKILFTDEIDPESVSQESVYLLKKKRPASLNLIDFLTEYSHENSVLSEENNPITLEQNNRIISIHLNEGDLQDNTEYLVVVRESVQSIGFLPLGEAYYWSFITKLNPLYGDIERIRDDVDPFLKNVSDSVIYRYMHDVSVEAKDIIDRAGNTSINLDVEVPFYVTQYVRAKTAYNLMVNAHVGGINETGISKKLGDLQIDRKSNVADIAKILREFKDRIKPLLDRLHGHNNRGYAKPVTVVRGEQSQPYPEHLTRNEFNGLEG